MKAISRALIKINHLSSSIGRADEGLAILAIISTVCMKGDIMGGVDS